jgi:hypothetical protein
MVVILVRVRSCPDGTLSTCPSQVPVEQSELLPSMPSLPSGTGAATPGVGSIVTGSLTELPLIAQFPA